MQRNLYRRVEVGVPIISPTHKAQLQHWLRLHVQDNTKGMALDAGLEIVHLPGGGTSAVRAQEAIYRWLGEKEVKIKRYHSIDLSLVSHLH